MRITSTSVEVIPPGGYRGPLWYAARRRGVSASEIAQVLGLSPYGSRFDLWWSKRLGEGDDGDSRQMSRGRRVEPLVLEDWAEQYPDFALRAPVGLVQNERRPWQLATPDGLAYEGGVLGAWVEVDDREPIAVVEAKTAGGREGWGDNGTDDIPVAYRAQVLWQMDTLGLDLAYVPVWMGFDYRCYVVRYDAEDVDYMREEALAFLSDVEHDHRPNIDAHAATTARLKRLHPTVEDTDVEVPEAIVRQYRAAKALKDAADERVSLAENRLRALMGNAQRATVDGKKVASRSVYDVAASTRDFPAYTVNRLNVSKLPKPKTSRPTLGRKRTTTPKEA